MRRSPTTATEPPFTVPATVEQLLLTASAFWVLAANRPFFSAALSGRALSAPGTWGFALAVALVIGALHFVLLAPWVNRFTVKPVLALLVLVTAFATYFMQSYGVYLDPSMLRNVMHTDPAEARELWSWRLLPHLAIYAALPLALLARVRVVRRPWARAAAVRIGATVGVAALGVGTLLAIYQPAASMMRNHKEMRYLVTPANLLWSAGAALGSDAQGAVRPRTPIGLDAAAGRRWAVQSKPLVVVLVVGETARAANWGLNGYARQTTPELAALPAVINFPDVRACGTNTETSLPCMFAPVGRRDYDQARIQGSESLLHVLARAGVQVHWRDNQAGCKGVCEGLPSDKVTTLNPPGLCADGRCLDEGLLAGLDQRLAQAQGRQLLVLHMLGNHGPSYFRRYPPAFAHYRPVCESDDLQQCSREEIVNAYDNALRYSDHVLGSLIAKLQAQAQQVDSIMLYVSDHGESLGENGLYLHGVPYAIAPDGQTQVPMLMWQSAGAAGATGVSADCLRRRATEPVAHDHLFHTLLGLLDVRTRLYEPAWDLGAGCRAGDANERDAAP